MPTGTVGWCGTHCQCDGLSTVKHVLVPRPPNVCSSEKRGGGGGEFKGKGCASGRKMALWFKCSSSLPSARWTGYKKQSFCSEDGNCSSLLPSLDVPDPFPLPFAPRVGPVRCSLLLLKSQRRHVCGDTVFAGEGRPTCAWRSLEPIALPVAWSPVFVLWIRSLFFAFF